MIGKVIFSTMFLLVVGAIFVARSPMFAKFQKKTVEKLVRDYRDMNKKLKDIKTEKLKVSDPNSREMQLLIKEEIDALYKLKKMRIKIGDRNWRYLSENHYERDWGSN